MSRNRNAAFGLAALISLFTLTGELWIDVAVLAFVAVVLVLASV
jgi:hypothetical protein